MTTIRLWRGQRANLPLAAPDGIPMWCSDTRQLFMGTDDGRVLLAGPSDDQASPSSAVQTLGGTPVFALDGSALGVLSGPAEQPAQPASALQTLTGASVITLDGQPLATHRNADPDDVASLTTLAGARALTLSGGGLTTLG